MGRFVVTVLCFISSVGAFSIDKDEPQCLSRFDYDYKVLQKLVALEQQQTELRETITKQKDLIEQLRLGTKDQLAGSTYVRWGRTSCPCNGSELVYHCYTAGSWYEHSGSAANFLCLPNEPLWGHYEDAVQSSAEVWGAEYELDGRDLNRFFGGNIHNENVPCAVCRTTRTSILMIPGRNACYPGWTLEYKGYLTAGHNSQQATEFVCLDDKPETIAGGHADQNGHLLYFAEVRCGSLKCPPYVNGRELTCAVCTF